jgi:PAS domain S-box-containing protein
MHSAVEPDLTFLTGGGGMGARIRAHDWSGTPLGSIEQWPGALRMALSLVLNSRFPNYLCWGADFISFHNDACVPLLGEKVALGRRFCDVWPEAWDTMGPIAHRAFEGEASFFEDLPLVLERHGFREQAWCTCSYSPVRDEAGDVKGILCTVSETTARVNALAALQEKEENLRQLNETLARQVAAHAADRDRLWRISQDVMAAASLSTGRFLTVNPAFTDTFGWSEQEATSIPFMEMVYPDDRDDVARNMMVLASGTPLVRYHTRVLHKNGGHRWVSWTIVPEGELLYGVARDITAQKMQENALRQAEDALRQSQKMEAVGQLTGGLAHDFNNMLAGVAGHLELMKLRLKLGQGGDLAQRIDAALGVTRRAAALTHRLLAFSRRQALDPKPTDVNELVASLSELVCRTAGPAISLAMRLQPGLWTTFCDPNQLESALLNLANNARDAMPDGGKLLVETANTPLRADAAGLYPGLAAGDYITVSVSDNGAGMPADVLARAFDPFFTTKPLGQGTGLGLSMVYGFATQSGGHVQIDSEAGRGTTVRLTLPRHAADGAPAERAQADGTVEAGLGKGVVLVVDDEAEIRMAMSEVLRMHGYTVLEAGDAHTALGLLHSATAPDVLVTDVGLPGGMNGRQLADIARAQWSQLPVLLITGYAESTVMKNEPLPSRMELLTKPFVMNALLGRVRVMAGQGP